MLIPGVTKNQWSKTKDNLVFTRNFPIDSIELYFPLGHPVLIGNLIISKDLNAHSCTVTGATHVAPTHRAFNGTSDKIVIPSDASLSINAEGSVGLWINPTTLATNDVFIGRYKDGAPAGWYFRTDGATAARLEFSPDDTLHVESTSSVLVQDTWSFVFMTFDTNGNYRLFHNADIVKSTSGGQTAPVESGDDIWIGGLEVASLFFPGHIGEVWVYSRVLSTREVFHIHDATKWRYI